MAPAHPIAPALGEGAQCARWSAMHKSCDTASILSKSKSNHIAICSILRRIYILGF